MPTTVRLAPALALFAFPMAVSLSAQADDATITLAGTVVDASSDAPIAGAVVGIDGLDRAVLTDDDGRWTLRDVVPGVLTLEFEQLGYAVLAMTLEARRDPAPIDVALERKPVELEGLRVMADRLKQRRLAAGISSRTLRSADFADQSQELLFAVRALAGIQLTTCTGRDQDAYWCVHRRGRTISPAVWVDDRYSLMGLDELEFYWPSEIYAVEVYQRGSAIRIYTRQYMETIASAPGPLPPIWLR